jgi:hypothetical protein
MEISVRSGAHLPSTGKSGADVSGPAAAQRVLGRLQQSVINPVVRRAWDLGLPIPGDALLGQASVPGQAGAHTPLHESDPFTELAEKYHISYGNPPWLDDVVSRYGLNRPTH